MGGFSSNYEGGYLNFDNDPKWMSEQMKKKDKYAYLRKKKQYTVVNGTNSNYLNILLTSADLLNETEQNKRTELCEIDDEDVLLELKHTNSEADDKTLEVYYEDTFIGSVQKIFEEDEIDNTSIVNEFYFIDDELQKVDIVWDGQAFYLKQRKSI